MPENRHVRFLLTLLYLALFILGGWLFLRVLLPWVLPFLLALGLAWLLERPVCGLVRRFHLRRWVASMLCTMGLALILGGALGLVLWRAVYEVGLLLGRLPVLLAGLPTFGGQVEDWAYRFIVAAPVQYQELLRSGVEGLVSQGISLPNRFYDWLAGMVTGAVGAIPDAALFVFTTALATYFSSATRSKLLAFLRAQVPPRWHARMDQGREVMKGAFGSWLRAQGILMLVTFGILTAGLLFLRVDLALLLAALVALVDALPIFGTGTVLVPWAAVSLLQRDWTLGVGLLVLFGLVSLVRSLLEPRLVGQRIGLPPLAALFAMYLGFSAFGVWGMVFSPLVAIFLKQLHDSGLVRLWKTEEPRQ